MGTPQAAVPTLNGSFKMVTKSLPFIRSPTGLRAAEIRSRFRRVKQYALDNGLEVLQPSKIRTPEALETFSLTTLMWLLLSHTAGSCLNPF
jgi:methionyl-tRNA formyltransferase